MYVCVCVCFIPRPGLFGKIRTLMPNPGSLCYVKGGSQVVYYQLLTNITGSTSCDKTGRTWG